MEDVAVRAGVSRALVSIVFRDAPGAGAATRERVRRAADELGFRPDHRARLLGRARTRLIGVVFGVDQAFHGDLVEQLYAAAEPLGYDVALSAVAPSRDEGRAAQSLLDYRCEALILLGPRRRGAELAALAGQVPTVVVARKVGGRGVEVVRSDDADGLAQAVRHLAGLGHRDIAHVDGGRAPGAADRRRGYRTTMRGLGLSDRMRLVGGGLTEADGVRAAAELLAGPRRPSAVSVFNDQSAIGVLDTMRQAGVRIPGELSVVGFDDDRFARLANLNLTTVRQDAAGLATLAVRRAVARLGAGPGGPGEGEAEVGEPGAESVVPPSLVIRGTTGVPPG
jgi:DNA-binding LacI/PurR family transcriptional regulator